MRINVAKKPVLERVLKRKQWHGIGPEQVDLEDMLKSILKWANEFVPSESGSILLDDPVLDESKRKPGKLYFVACFGKGSKSIMGNNIPISVGIVGNTYMTGRPYISRDVESDNTFYKEIDKKTKFRTKSIICVPIGIKNSTVGVLELINKAGGESFDKRDLMLLKIFAGYTSTLLQNSLDAKRFGELSIMDNLTGLYNDRYFFDRLAKEVHAAVSKKRDLSLVFFDLDRFKQVNDTHGHLAGSRLLSEMGTLLKSISGGNFVPVRYGGDEFTVILPDKNIKIAEEFAESLRRTIEGHVFLEKKVRGLEALKIKGLITASIGVASMKQNVKKSNDVSRMREALIKASDTAMYTAKQNGKNKVTVSKKIYS